MNMVAKSVEHRLPMWKVRSSTCIRVKPMTYKIDTCHYLVCYLSLIGSGNGWLVVHCVQYHDNVTLWDIRFWWLGFPVGQQYKAAMSAQCCKSVCILV